MGKESDSRNSNKVKKRETLNGSSTRLPSETAVSVNLSRIIGNYLIDYEGLSPLSARLITQCRFKDPISLETPVGETNSLASDSEETLADFISSTTPTPEEEIIYKGDDDLSESRFARVLSRFQLSGPQKRALTLKCVYGLESQEIAEAMGLVSLQSAKGLISGGLANIRKSLCQSIILDLEEQPKVA